LVRGAQKTVHHQPLEGRLMTRRGKITVGVGGGTVWRSSKAKEKKRP